MIVSAICASALFSTLSLSADGTPFHLTEATEVKFATKAEGTKLLGDRDLYIRQMSMFDRQVRMQVDRSVSEDEYLQFERSQVRSWNDDDKQKLLEALSSLKTRVRQFELPLPNRILLIRSAGNEQAGAPYTRGNAIVLTRNTIRGPAAGLQRLLAHELFHVLSRASPNLRHRLYRIVDFEHCANLQLPESFQARMITNPDAPDIAYRIELRWNNKLTSMVPVLVSKSPTYDARRGGRLFNYLQFRLLVVKQTGEKWHPMMRDDAPLLLEHTKVPDYVTKIGNNTRYVIHPEEILADNFAHLLMQTADLPNPWVVEKMREVLSRPGGEQP